MSSKFARNQQGSLNILLVPLILCVILLLGSLGFGAWAFIERSEYKDNSDQKAEAASVVAAERAKTEKDNEFLQREKEPYKTYSSPIQYGSFSLKYPKTWSVYANEQPNQITLLMQPDTVSSNPNTPYTLKVEVLNRTYSQQTAAVENNIKIGKLKASAITLPLVPGTVGLRVDGQLTPQKSGSSVYFPMRDKTLHISTESTDKIPDFNNIILPNFEFTP